MVYCGIDPGGEGCLAVINDDTNAITLVPYNSKDYADALEEVSLHDAFCVVERVWSSPQMGVRSAFSFGEKLGEIHGMLDALGIPYQLVIPQKWKAFFGVTADKNTSIACAHRLFPKVSLRKTERCKKDHDGLAEALLMASYARHLNRA